MHPNRGAVADLADHVKDLWETVVSPATARTYHTAIQHFLQFITLCSIITPAGHLPPLSEDLLINYVTYCFKSLSLKYNTIKLYLAGIRFHYLKAGFNNPLNGFDRLDCILRSIKRRDSGSSSLKRLPITFEVLEKMCYVLQRGFVSPFIDIMLQCACSMAFFGFLRCGEFTVRCATSCEYLCIGDISIAADQSFYTVNLRVSKTDPFRKGVTIHIFENDILNPVQIMYKFVSTRLGSGANLKSPLFIDSDDKILSRDKFIVYIRDILSKIGLCDLDYCGHSFRIGAATSAAAVGIEDHLIQTLGRWSSNCYTRYIRTSTDTIKSAQRHMCSK